MKHEPRRSLASLYRNFYNLTRPSTKSERGRFTQQLINLRAIITDTLTRARRTILAPRQESKIIS